MNEELTQSAITAAAIKANDAFYRALEQADLVAMEALWLHTAWVKCVHPGWPVLMGWEAIKQSWQEIFAGQSRLRVRPADISILLADDFACISCAEQLAVFNDDTDRPPVAITTNATNLFQRINGVWRMLHHHASRQPVIKILDDELDNKDEGNLDGV